MNITRKLMSASGGIDDSYWINLLGGTGNDRGYGVATDSSGNIIVVGYTYSDGAGGNDLLIVKYDSSGTLLWDKTLGGTENDNGNGVATDSSGNIIVVGSASSDGAGGIDLLIVKYDSSGTLLWNKTLGGASSDYGYGVATDSSGNIIVAGHTNSDGAGGYDLLVAKYNSSGTLLWGKTLGGTGTDYGLGVTTDSSGNIIVAGRTTSDGAGGIDLLVVKYDSSGTLLWGKTLGGIETDAGNGVATDSSGNIIVAGSTLIGGLLIVKYDSSGTLLWDKTLGGAGTDVSQGVATDSSGNIIVVGSASSDGAGYTDLLVAKYDSSGTLLWDKTLGGASSDYGNGVTTDSSGNIIVVGYTYSDGAGDYDILVAKLPPDGTGDGTYGSLIYQDAVLTDAAAVLTDAAAVLTDAAAVLTDAAAVLTDAEAVLTSEFFEITP